jgi:hypothetical protein
MKGQTTSTKDAAVLLIGTLFLPTNARGMFKARPFKPFMGVSPPNVSPSLAP